MKMLNGKHIRSKDSRQVCSVLHYFGVVIKLNKKNHGSYYCLRNPDGNARFFDNVFKLSGFETS